MRIALISPYALSAHGGVQEQVLSMSRELSRRGHEVLVVAPDQRDVATYDTPARVERFGHLVRLPANGSRAPLTLSPLATRRSWFAVDQFKPDVVHFHEPFAPMIGWGTLRTHRAPSVATFHRSGDGPALRLTKPLLRAFAKDVDVAVAVSQSAATTIEHACAQLKLPLKGATVVVQGFGNAGSIAADLLHRAGARVIAVSNAGDLYVGAGVAYSSAKGVYKYHDGAWTKLTGVPGTGPADPRGPGGEGGT